MIGLSVLLKIVTFIPSAVRLVERLFRDRSGGEKHDAAIDLLKGVLPLLGVNDTEATGILLDGINEIINGTVKVLHAIGEFKHKDE